MVGCLIKILPGMLCCRNDEHLVVKIVYNIEKYHYAVGVEVNILSDLQKSDSSAKE